MNAKPLPKSVLVAVFAISIGTTHTFAAEPNAPAPTKEMRENMAAVHEKMAACLRSESPFAECQAQMQKHCRETMNEQGCSMMGHGMGRMREPAHH